MTDLGQQLELSYFRMFLFVHSHTVVLILRHRIVLVSLHFWVPFATPMCGVWRLSSVLEPVSLQGTAKGSTMLSCGQLKFRVKMSWRWNGAQHIICTVFCWLEVHTILFDMLFTKINTRVRRCVLRDNVTKSVHLIYRSSCIMWASIQSFHPQYGEGKIH